jgi:hypothetical protein
MSKSKHRQPLRAWLDELTPDEDAPPDISGLPLFDWADSEDRPVVATAGSSWAREEC